MPPPPLKRIKRPPKVLEEDEYTAALSDIIARDYFPGLRESQAQHEYLAALESGNDAWIAEAGQKLRDAAAPATRGKRRSARNTRFEGTPSATPRTPMNGRVPDTPVGYTGSETPMTVAESEVDNEREMARKELDTSTLSLGAFQAKYTSEDNESFNTVLDKQNQKRREKHAYLWTQDQRLPSARQIAHRAREAKLLKQREEDAVAGRELVPMTSGATDSRPAKPDTWTIKRPNNTFMFNAGSVDEDGLQTVQELKEQNSKAGPKQVVHANTRFPSLQYVDDPAPIPPSPSLNTEIIAQRGAKRRGDTDTESASDFPGSDTPRVNGYAFVDEDEPENIAASQVEGPSYRDLLAGQVGDSNNPFQIRELRRREDLHLRMLDKQARRKREAQLQLRRGGAAGTPLLGTPATVGGRTPASIAGNMTPAARRLMEKLGGSGGVAKTSSPAAQGAGGGDVKGRVEDEAKDMWTPVRTPRRKNGR